MRPGSTADDRWALCAGAAPVHAHPSASSNCQVRLTLIACIDAQATRSLPVGTHSRRKGVPTMAGGKTFKRDQKRRKEMARKLKQEEKMRKRMERREAKKDPTDTEPAEPELDPSIPI